MNDSSIPIDHMSAMKVDEIREKGGKMLCLSLFCGGLLQSQIRILEQIYLGTT
jgi:hypothetical protein